jgi:hypothetical protein
MYSHASAGRSGLWYRIVKLIGDSFMRLSGNKQMILAYKLSRMSVNAATNLWQALYGGVENRRLAEQQNLASHHPAMASEGDRAERLLWARNGHPRPLKFAH